MKMKRQYLGDWKDSFKWEYHDYLLQQLHYEYFQIVWMMTPDYTKSHGGIGPDRFPARPEILRLCRELRANRKPEKLESLPGITSASYKVISYRANEYLTYRNRTSYFSDIAALPNQVLFLDPDNGFEPEGKCKARHIGYTEIDSILQKLPSTSIISVFHHFRRKRFSEDFARIRERLHSGFSTAIHWHFLMFVAVSPSEAMIDRARAINLDYAKSKSSVQVIE